MGLRQKVVAALAMLVVVAGCAKGGPGRPQDGGTLDAHVELDASPAPDDAGEVMIDAMPIDAPSAEPDAWTPPPVDAWVPPPIDGGPTPGTGAYLDRCTADGDCASGRCTDDVGATRFCTRACTGDALCAHEHTCAAGFCVPEDTGAPCSTATPATCAQGLCLGGAAGGRCTRECASADECPSGFACTEIGSPALRVCVDIEHPCASAAECGTGLCFADVGCTATCRTAADCPRRLASIGLPPYACVPNAEVGASICVPPDDVVGPDPIGTACSVGFNTCRSAACDDGAPLGPMCTQACTAQGGCAPGLGCQPVPADDTSFALTCQRAGTGDIGQPCGAGRDCHSSLCTTAGYCTRLCADGLCPTGMSCMPVPGAGVAMCRRP